MIMISAAITICSVCTMKEGKVTSFRYVDRRWWWNAQPGCFVINGRYSEFTV